MRKGLRGKLWGEMPPRYPFNLPEEPDLMDNQYQGAHYREKSGNLGKMGKIREFYKNMSGKYQGIFSLFHNLKKITEMMLYMIKMLCYIC